MKGFAFTKNLIFLKKWWPNDKRLQDQFTDDLFTVISLIFVLGISGLNWTKNFWRNIFYAIA